MINEVPKLTEADRQAIEEQIPMLTRYARSLARDVTLADDVVQNALERAIRKYHLYEQGTNLSRWMATILHNEFINAMRRKTRRGPQVPIEDWQDDVSTAPRQDNIVGVHDLDDAFSALPDQDREILVMVGIEGHSYDYAAEKLGIAVGTVKSRLHRARERLRAEIEKTPDPQPAGRGLRYKSAPSRD